MSLAIAITVAVAIANREPTLRMGARCAPMELVLRRLQGVLVARRELRPSPGRDTHPTIKADGCPTGFDQLTGCAQ